LPFNPFRVDSAVTPAVRLRANGTAGTRPGRLGQNGLVSA
jgi:hypothetical protein